MSRLAAVPRRLVLAAALAVLLTSVLGRAQDGPEIRSVGADPTPVDEGDPVAFEVDARHPASAPMRFGWDFGDGTSLAPDPAGDRTFAVYLDDGAYDATVTVEDGEGRTAERTVRVSVRNVAPEIRDIDRDGATLERARLTFRARAIDPGDDELVYMWDFGDGTVVGPSRDLDVARHAYRDEGAYTLTLTVEDGDGGTARATETIVVGAGFRFSATVGGGGSGASPYLMGLPVVREGQRIYFAGDLGAASRGEPAADAGAPCLIAFGGTAPTISAVLEEGTHISFTGLFPNGLAEGTYDVAVVRNEIPIPIYEVFEREWAQPNTFFAHVETTRMQDGMPDGSSFHGTGGAVVVQRWEDGRVELTFSAGLEETLGALDFVEAPGPRRFRPALTGSVSGSFAHEISRSLRGGDGSLNAISGSTYGDWYLCAPRDPLEVEEVVPSPDLATAGGAARDVPLVDFEDPELVVRFSRPVDIGSAVENVVLEWRRANGAYVDVPILVIGEGDDTLRLLPLDDLMDGVVYRARVIGGLEGIQGRDGEVMAEDEEWLFETLLDLSEERNGVTLATTQVARDAPLVADKPTETRVYLNWREKPQVHREWQARYATFEVAVDGADYAPQRVRVKRPDLYGPVETKYALDSVNFYGWEPGGGGSYDLTARVTQVGQVGPERGFEGIWTADGYGAAPALTFDYHFVRVGSWADGVPAGARQLGHRIARLGATFTEQTFPVPDVIARSRGDVVVEEPDSPIVEAMGEEFYLSSLVTASRRDEVLVESFAERLGATDADVVVAFLPSDVLRLSGFQYRALGTNPRVIAVKVDPSQKAAAEYFPSTVAHEIGHAFGLDHNTDCPSENLQACVDVGRSDPIEGTRIASGGASGWNKSKWSGNAEVGATPGEVFSLMHPANLPDRAVFVTNQDYARLQDAVRTLAARPGAPVRSGLGSLRVQEERAAGLQVAGAVDLASGRAELFSVVPAVGPPAPDAAPDGLHLEARDGAGGLLARAAVVPLAPDRWHAPDAADGPRPFTAFLPSGADVAVLALLDGARVLVERHASAHAPTVTPPDAPWDARDVAVLDWAAADADGDPLRFDVDYAPDGRDWRPLAIGLHVPSLRLDPAALEPGAAPAVRIVARDGLRAAAAEVAVTLDAGPRLAATDPAEGESVPPTTAVTVWTLGEVAEPGPETLTLVREDASDGASGETSDGATERVSGRVEPLPSGAGVRFVPDAPLAADATYRATFGDGARGADGALATPFAWSFRTGEEAPDRAVSPRNLFGRPLTSAAEQEEPSANAAPGGELPASCAGIEQAAFAPLLPSGAILIEAGEADGACRLVVTATATPEQVRGFVERAILTNRLFLTGNRTEGEVVTIGARGAAFDAEATIEPGPPTRLTWTLAPSE